MKTLLFVCCLCIPGMVLAGEEVKKEALSVFQQYLEMHEELKAIAATGAGKDSHQYKQLQAKIDSTHQYVYLRSLRKTKDYIVQTGDRELLTAVMKVVLATSYRVDDYQIFALGDIYLAQSDSLIHIYRQFSSSHQKVLYEKLEKGFVRVSFKNKDVQNYDALKAKLFELQTESSQ